MIYIPKKYGNFDFTEVRVSTISGGMCFLTGVIRTALGPGDMDREQREHYQVVIEAKDMAGQRGGLTGTTVVNITLTDVNDNPPRFTQSKGTDKP